MQKIKKIVDLSHELKNGTVVYPGDPVVDITVATVKERCLCREAGPLAWNPCLPV